MHFLLYLDVKSCVIFVFVKLKYLSLFVPNALTFIAKTKEAGLFSPMSTDHLGQHLKPFPLGVLCCVPHPSVDTDT